MADTNKIFEYVELKYENLTWQINNWLQKTYNKSSILLNSASPYGQLLEVTKELFRWNILYQKNSIRQLDIDQSKTKRSIQNIARISGHNPTRSMAANGTLKFKLKQGISIEEEVKGSTVVIYDDTLTKNITNSLFYSLKIGQDKSVYPLTPGCEFFVHIVQGKIEKQTYTGDGTNNQSFSVVVDTESTIDNFLYTVTYNGVLVKIKDHLYDMLDDELACYTRTGFNGGLDIYFGNGVNGIVPNIGSYVEVNYLLTDGTAGNILNNKVNDFRFVDDLYDSEGNIISTKKLFDVFVETDITFASNGESIEYTKAVVPFVSRNFVLATPAQFMYHLKKTNLFSKVNAFNRLDMVKIDIDSDGDIDDVNINEMYLYLIPKISNYFTGDVNYFNSDFQIFYLDQSEKDRVIKYLKKQGTLSITAILKIIDPIIRKFVVNVYLRAFQDANEDNIKEQVISTLSEFFIDNERFDRVVKADIINALKDISGIDSVNVEFISQQNEDYHKDGAILKKKKQDVIQTTYVLNKPIVTTPQSVSMKPVSTNRLTTMQGRLATDSNIRKVDSRDGSADISTQSETKTTIVTYKTIKYDENKLIGIDPILGDIILKRNEFAILRGGWKDRNDVYYYEDPKTSKTFSSVNIIWRKDVKLKGEKKPPKFIGTMAGRLETKANVSQIKAVM